MNEIIDVVARNWNTFSTLEFTLLGSCLLLVIFARKILGTLFHLGFNDRQNVVKLQVFRAVCLLIIMVLLLNHFVFPGDRESIASKVVGVIMVLFCAFWATQVLKFFIRRQYGHAREVNGNKVISDTYNSRLLSLLVTVLVVIVALIGIVQVLGFNSLLEAGGMIGFLGVMLALTQASWAPDIISGLIILNSGLVDEEDVIEMGDGVVAQVFRTKLFHTELLNLIDNHRIMIKNAQLRDMSICNYSKFASAKGLREKLAFKIGYDVEPDDVKDMFEAAFVRAVEDSSIPINEGHAMEIRVLDTGDYAVEWGVFYYVNDKKRIKEMVKTKQFFREMILEESLKRGISLATPDLFQNALAGAAPVHPVESDTKQMNFPDPELESISAELQQKNKE